MRQDHTRFEEIFTESTTLPALGKMIVTRMLTRDTFAVATLLVKLNETPER